jgi:hypothetical protein
LLRRLVHVHDGLIDLFDPGALSDRRGRDLRHDVGDTFDERDDLLHRLARVIDELAPGIRLLNRCELIRLLCVFGVLPDRRGQFLDARGGLFEARRLLFGPLRPYGSS